MLKNNYIKFVMMDTLKIDILNPKALKLLKDLAELNLISIQDSKPGFKEMLKSLRSANAEKTISLEDITKEVEAVRSKRLQ